MTCNTNQYFSIRNNFVGLLLVPHTPLHVTQTTKSASLVQYITSTKDNFNYLLTFKPLKRQRVYSSHCFNHLMTVVDANDVVTPLWTTMCITCKVCF